MERYRIYLQDGASTHNTNDSIFFVWEESPSEALNKIHYQIKKLEPERIIITNETKNNDQKTQKTSSIFSGRNGST